MKRVMIFDDEPLATQSLKAMVEKYDKEGILSISRAHSLTQLQESLMSEGYPDILLADILMPKGNPDGIEIVTKLFPPKSGTQVIFFSGMLEKALDVYSTSHVYFLLKPVKQDRLNEAMDKALENLQKDAPRMYRIKSKANPATVRMASIKYVESNVHKVIYHTVVGDFEEYSKLDDVQKNLADYFVRIHKSYLVNANFISQTRKGHVELADGAILPISRARMQDFQKALANMTR